MYISIGLHGSLKILIDSLQEFNVCKKRHCLCFHLFTIVVFFACATTNLEFKTTRVEDTKLAVAVTPL